MGGGRVVLVTGGSRGIGRAVATAFADAGDRVVVHYRADADAAAQTLGLLAGPPPYGPHLARRADLADPEQARALVDDVVAETGRLDVVVNNAGVYERQDVLAATFEQWRETWERTVATNLLGPAHVSWCAARHMAAAGGGRIVNVSSRGAYRGEPHAPAYGASKAGLNALGQSLAQALGGHGIGVATVAPGFVETDMAADLLDGPQGDTIRAQSPLGRVARPEEVAAVVLFLASDQATFTTGAVVDVNGASHLR